MSEFLVLFLSLFVFFFFFVCGTKQLCSTVVMYLGKRTLGYYHPLILCCTCVCALNDGV